MTASALKILAKNQKKTLKKQTKKERKNRLFWFAGCGGSSVFCPFLEKVDGMEAVVWGGGES
jgi:hypothetical protein